MVFFQQDRDLDCRRLFYADEEDESLAAGTACSSRGFQVRPRSMMLDTNDLVICIWWPVSRRDELWWDRAAFGTEGHGLGSCCEVVEIFRLGALLGNFECLYGVHLFI